MFFRQLLLLVFSSLGTILYGAYGLQYNHEKDVGRAQESYFAPVNASVFRLCQPDGVTRDFLRDADERNMLQGESPWCAELDGARAIVMTDPDFKGGQTGFMFLNGFLRRILADGREYAIPRCSLSKQPAQLVRLWPPAEKRQVAAEAPDVWRNAKRLRLWFDNPNMAGALFAEVALATLALFFLKTLWARILGGVLFLPAFLGLVLTSSRGGFLAFLCGLGILLLTRLRFLIHWRRLALLALVVVLAVGGLFALGQGERLGRNLFHEGQRETSRLTVWKEVPRMMVDAPAGWGLGQSGRAYIDWYQTKNDCLLKNLISGHLTLLVELSWPLRFVYLFLWIFVIGFLVYQMVFRGALPVPGAIILSFFVAGCFNPVVQEVELWIIPVFALGAVCVAQGRKFDCRRGLILSVLVSLLVALTVICGVCVVAHRQNKDGLSIRRVGDAVCLKGDRPDVWLVDDGYTLHGGYWWMFGKEFRAGLEKPSQVRSVAYLGSVVYLPDEVVKLVLVGEAGRAFLELKQRPKAAEVVFLSPPFSWEEVPADLSAATQVKFVVGGLAARYMGGEGGHPAWVTVIPGALLYIPNWLDYLN